MCSTTKRETWRNNEKVYTFLEMEAALGIWEHLCEVAWRPDLVDCYKNAYGDMVREWFAEGGTVNTRLEITPRIAQFALDLWEYPGVQETVQDRAGWSYDWEFLPFVCRLVIRLNGNKPVFPPLHKVAHTLFLETGCPIAEMDEEEKYQPNEDE